MHVTLINWVTNVALAAIAIGLLIFVHELGHFLSAKAIGVRVETFSLGFWKKLVGFRRGDTEYRLSLIPLGGYVKLAGEMEGEGTGAPDEFSSKSPGRRAFVLVSGVAMNAVFALLAFVVAFTIGVPFEVAEVGRVDQGLPAWEAGLAPGDRIVRLNNVTDPDFEDVQRQVALMGRESVTAVVDREGRELVFEIYPAYDERMGMRVIGFTPPLEPVVTGLASIDGQRPAQDAGVELGDRILRVNGRQIKYYRHLQEALQGRAGETIELELLRNGETLSVAVETLAAERYVMGISGADTKIQALQGGGAAAEAGFRTGDRITAVEGRNVRSTVELEDAIEEMFGSLAVSVDRDGAIMDIGVDIPDRSALREFMFSFTTGASNELTWVRRDGPAWEAGMSAGDIITSIGDRQVTDWQDVVEANHRLGSEPRTVAWRRNGEGFEARLVPERDMNDRTAQIGAHFSQMKYRVRREGVLSSISTGAHKTYGALADMVFTIRGFARREVSPQHVGGIVLIAHVAYHAASRGVGQLLYFSAMISMALAFLNILPIPVLDGGHLMFIGIEKIRGRPVGEKAKAVSQSIGLTLLLLLVAYAFRNDILRLLG